MEMVVEFEKSVRSGILTMASSSLAENVIIPKKKKKEKKKT
jgi:hypothetical protein